MNPVFYHASRLTKTVLTEQEITDAATFLSNMQDNQPEQDAFFSHCRIWKIAPWLHTQLERTGLKQYISDKTRTDFQSIHDAQKTENERRNAEAVRFLKAFEKAGVELAVLKGNLFAHTIYKDTGYKRMNDFDLLIHPADWQKVQQVYADLDYIPLGFGWSGEKQKPAKFSHTGISFISRNFHCIIGTQWGLKSATTRYRVDMDAAWETSKPFDFYGVATRQLSPEFNLLHLVLHMGIYKCGIRDCMDVHNLLLSRTDWEPSHLRAMMEASNAVDKAWFTLQMAQACSGGVPQEILETMNPSARSYVTARLEKRLAASGNAGDVQVSYCDYFQDVEKNVIYFNLFQKFHKKALYYARILRMIFWPERNIALKLSDKSYRPGIPDRLKARICAPFLVFALIAEEIGWTFTYLLFVKLFVDWLLSVRYYFIPATSYFEYLRKRGIDPKTIENVVKNIQ